MDFNAVCISNLMAQLGNHTNAQLEEGMVRHMVLNSIRSFKQKFGEEFGDIVIACDNTNIWRKKIFPYYKANRKKAKENSDLDWNALFGCLNKIREELKEFFPYKIIDCESAEADDIIGVLCREFGSELNVGEKILILSGDKDFIQLHVYANIKQYDPVRKKWITNDNPEKYLAEHIMKGDSGDGVPNILSADNCFVVGDRQKPLTQKKIDNFINNGITDTTIERNYARNKMIIDLSYTPQDLQEKILEQYYNYPKKDKSMLMNYFMDNKLKNLMVEMNSF